MKMTLLTGGDFEEILFKDVPRIGDVDVLVFASNILRRVDLVAEMEGSSSQIEQLCLLSRNLECVLLAGCDTEVCGTLHKSCVVVDEGELLGIVDMVNVIPPRASSVSLWARTSIFRTWRRCFPSARAIFSFPFSERLRTLCPR